MRPLTFLWGLLHVNTTSGIILPTSSSYTVDRTATSHTFDGIGGLSGGGATSRLLPDYAEPARAHILDYLFEPDFGASLQVLKVEIGGDSQSTDGTEASHMHDSDTVNLHAGYEWWLMKEAKARNPDIKLYGLAWAFPGWVGGRTNEPFDYPELTVRYLVEWVKGAKTEHGLKIDYLGIWNERSSDSTFVQMLRNTLNVEGFSETKLVVKDGSSTICSELANDTAYAASVDVIGLHYPTDYGNYEECQSLGKPIWASEESSSFDDLNGAACWGRIINAHWVLNQMTSSIMWNLVGAYYHGTSWYASSLLTAVEPWSGHYEINPVIWATAHVTQFTKVGWKYLANGSGSGELSQGGYYVTWVDPLSKRFTMNVVKISREHASCTRPKLPDFNASAETVVFKLASSMKAPSVLQVWHSNFETFDKDPPLFEHSTVAVKDGMFSLDVQVGDMYTVTTMTQGKKGSFGKIPESFRAFPLPYEDDFQDTPDSQGAKWLADQIGAFEVHDADDGKKSLVQMVPEQPIGWSDHGSRGPVSLIGMREWQDINISVDFRLPKERSLPLECGADSFPIDLTDRRCMGLDGFPGVSSASECRQLCCGLPTCSVWQWDVATGSCWAGHAANASSACSIEAGFQSQGREVPIQQSLMAGCLATRVDQMWQNGVIFCIDTEGQWNVTHAGPPLRHRRDGNFTRHPRNVASGKTSRIGRHWHRATLSVEGGHASVVLDGAELVSEVVVRDMDTGFAALGANGWFRIEYRNLAIVKTATGWEEPVGCPTPKVGTQLVAATCARNGLVRDDQGWNLLPSFQLQHHASGLCASLAEDGVVELEDCDSTSPHQQFVHDYTRIRNTETSITVNHVEQFLTGTKSGDVTVGMGGDWNTWSYFPNTRQLRNQYTSNRTLGPPMCLTACPPSRRRGNLRNLRRSAHKRVAPRSNA